MKKRKPRNKKENYLAKQYKSSWAYIKESKNFIFIILTLFILAVLTGLFFPLFFRQIILKFFSELAEKVEGLDFKGLLFFILQNNVKASFYGLILGIIFGIFPVINIIINGYVLGFVGNIAVKTEGLSALLKLLPHGIFELPALILSLSLGLKLGLWFTKKDAKLYLKYNLENSLRVFLFVILPLLILAGIIEAGLIFLLR